MRITQRKHTTVWSNRSLRIGSCVVCLLFSAVLAGCQLGATPTPEVILYVRPTPKPTRTIEQMVEDATTLAASSPDFLASQHLAKGAQCQSCHDPFPPTKPPASEPCLVCHGGSDERLAALRTTPATKWHEMHLDIITCADCHYGHEKFEVKCLICHPSCTLH